MTPVTGCLDLVAPDLWRCQGACSIGLFCKTWFQDPAFRPVFTLRAVQACSGSRWKAPLWLLAMLWHRRTQARCGVDIPRGLRVGPAFNLAHAYGIVINGQVTIGSNVTVMQGVTIGGTTRGVPCIEDEVIICANATVIGPVRLGRGAVVGAGCVVTHDVPANTTVVGNPQREIPRKRAPRGDHPAPQEVICR